MMNSDRDIAAAFRAEGMGCNCDLDNWQPEASTGHSWVCRIHKAVKAANRGDRPYPLALKTINTDGDKQ